MGFTETLRLLVEADTKGAVHQVENLGKTAEREGSRATKNLDKVGTSMTRVGAGMVAVGAVALVGLGHAAMASEEAEASTRKLQNSVANNPRLNAASAQSFIHLAEAIQDKTAADADDIIAGEAVLAQGKLSAEQMRTLIPLVVDLARKKGLDEVAAFTMASKAVDGNAGALKRAGISVDEAAFKTDAYGATVEALKGSVGGFAEEEGATFAGSLERLKNKMGDLEEGVGKGAVDAFTSLFGVVDGVTEKFDDLSPGAQGAIGKVATYGSIALIAVGATSTLIGQLIKARDNFGRMGGAISANSSALGRIGRVAATAATEFAILVEAGRIIDDVFRDSRANVDKMENSLLRLGRTGKVTGELSSKSGEDLHDLKNAIGDVFNPTNVERIGNVANELVHFGGAVGSTHLDRMHDEIADVDKALAQLASRSPREAAQALDALIEAMDLSTSDARNFRGALDEYNSTLASIDTDKAVQGAGDLGGAMDESGAQTDDAASALQEYSDLLQAMTDPLFAAVDALHGNRDAQLAVHDAQAKVLESTLAVTDAQAKHGVHSTEAAEATRTLQDAQRELNDAQWNVVDSASGADSALATLKDAVDRGDVSVEAFRSTLRTWVRQGFLTEKQANDAARGLGGLAARADEADSKRVDVPVATSGFGRAMTNLATLGQRVHALDGDSATVNVNFTSTGFGSLAAQLATLGVSGHRAHGGPVSRSRLYEVAEGDRSELLEMAGRTYLIPGSDGTVRPAAGAGTLPMPAVMAGGGGGGKLAITLNDNRTTVTLDDTIVFDQYNRRFAQNYGRSALRNLGR